MKVWLKRVLLVAALVGLGYWGWTLFFQSPEQAIRNRLRALAQEASFGPGQGLMTHAWKATSLSAFFTTNVQVMLDVPGGQHNINGLDELNTASLLARQNLSSLRIELPDVKVVLDPGNQSATVNVTIRGQAVYPSGQRDDYLQELRLRLIKVKNDWLIHEIVTVHTLS